MELFNLRLLKKRARTLDLSDRQEENQVTLPKICALITSLSLNDSYASDKTSLVYDLCLPGAPYAQIEGLCFDLQPQAVGKIQL